LSSHKGVSFIKLFITVTGQTISDNRYNIPAVYDFFLQVAAKYKFVNTYLENKQLTNKQFENRQLENEHLENKHFKNDIWKRKNIQHGLVWRECSASCQVKNSIL